MYYTCMNYMCDAPKTTYLYYTCNKHVAHLLVYITEKYIITILVKRTKLSEKAIATF